MLYKRPRGYTHRKQVSHGTSKTRVDACGSRPLWAGPDLATSTVSGVVAYTYFWWIPLGHSLFCAHRVLLTQIKPLLTSSLACRCCALVVYYRVVSCCCNGLPTVATLSTNSNFGRGTPPASGCGAPILPCSSTSALHAQPSQSCAKS